MIFARRKNPGRVESSARSRGQGQLPVHRRGQAQSGNSQYPHGQERRDPTDDWSFPSTKPSLPKRAPYDEGNEFAPSSRLGVGRTNEQRRQPPLPRHDWHKRSRQYERDDAYEQVEASERAPERGKYRLTSHGIIAEVRRELARLHGRLDEIELRIESLVGR
jgi:hypothetical protein